MSRLTPVVGLAAAVSGLACASPGIEGRVVDGYTGAPVVAHTVTLAGTTLTATTGDDGSYRFTEIGTGLQRVEPADGFVTAEPLEINVPDAAPIEAADLVVYAMPDATGAQIVHEGHFVALTHAERNSRALEVWLDVSVESTMPTLATGDVIVLRATQANPLPRGLELHRMERKRRLVHEYKDGRGRAYARPSVTPERLSIVSSDLPVRYERLTSELYTIEVGDLAPGMYVVTTRLPTSALSEIVTNYPFHVPMPPATLDGERLVVALGEHVGGSQPWTLAKERVAAWCSAGGSPACESALRAFDDPTTQGGFPQCEVRLTVRPANAELTSGECAVVGVRATARFTNVDGGYEVASVEVEPLAGGKGPPD